MLHPKEINIVKNFLMCTYCLSMRAIKQSVLFLRFNYYKKQLVTDDFKVLMIHYFTVNLCFY